MVLNTDAAVKAFARGGNVTLGGDLSVAAGPVGRGMLRSPRGLSCVASTPARSSRR
jgi:lipid-binding SYLF domain-containing protein